MKALNKTEQRIMDRMRHRYGHYAAVVSNGNVGSREFDACKSLVARGLAKLAHPVRSYLVYTGSGKCEHCTEISIRLI